MRGLRAHVDGEGPRVAVLFLCAALFLGAVVVVSLVRPLDPTVLLRDPLAMADLHPLSGFASNLGVLIWTGAAAVSVFGALQLRDEGADHRAIAFLAGGGLLSAMLLVDDLFMVHEELAGRYLGAAESVVLAAQALAVGVYLVVFRRRLARSAWLPLLLAFAFFGGSVGVDLVLEDLDAWRRAVGRWHYLVEDGAKFLGIVGWAAYFWLETRASLLTIRSGRVSTFPSDGPRSGPAPRGAGRSRDAREPAAAAPPSRRPPPPARLHGSRGR